MPPPSSLKIKTSSVTRLIKEEQTYHTELDMHVSKLNRMEAENADFYEIKTQKAVINDTKQMIPTLREKLENAVEALRLELELHDDETDETKAAKLAIEEGEKVYEGRPSDGSALFTDVS
ncbi:hypothetical protein TWF694_006522 [Orbilia ellipsospora]|uniref:Tubulin-specific chaperone A n=1 Tax=Orbilia ellipsospora TaxID=2528407 RepID=A0AAV9XKB6_9PEZI